jgi:hypothetical protein
MQKQKQVNTQQLYELIREPMRTNWWGDVASKLERAGVVDPKTLLVTEFGYSVQTAFYVDAPYSELAKCIMQKHDVPYAARWLEEAVALTMGESERVSVNADDVRLLAVKMLREFNDAVDRDITGFSPSDVNMPLLLRVMKVAGDVYGDTLGYTSLRGEDADETEDALRENVDKVLMHALCHRLGLMPDAMYLAEFLHQID